MSGDDTELYKSHSSQASTLSQTTKTCISDMETKTIENKLELKDDKTKILQIGSAPVIGLPSSVRVSQCGIPFSSEARNHGLIFNTEGTAGLSGDQADQFSPTVSVCCNHRNFPSLSCSLWA